MNRPKIPENIKKEVRINCYFGCIICGAPTYHYDHIDQYSIVQSHDVKNIILLCPNHHQDKTSGRISKSIIEKYVKNPANKDQVFSSPYKLFLDKNLSNLIVGSNKYIFSFNSNTKVFEAIIINKKTIVGIVNENGNFLLNLCMTNQEGKEILIIKNSEFEVSTEVWDFQYEGRRMKIRSEPYNVEFEMLILEDGIEITQGCFASPPFKLEIFTDKTVIWPGGNVVSGSIFEGQSVGIMIE